MSSTCIVVPAYNEAKRLDVAQLESYLARQTGVRFLFVNDGSTDETLPLLLEMRQRWPDAVSVLDVPHAGKAEAVRQGMWTCAADPQWTFIGYWDADWATPLDAIQEFQACLHRRPEVDFVLGARVALLGRMIDRKVYRHYLGRVAATAASLTLGLPVYDTQCGAKLLRVSERTRELFAEPFTSGWVFDVELIARYLRLMGTKAGLFELPLDRWIDVGESKVRAIHFVRSFGQMVDIYRRYRFSDSSKRWLGWAATKFSRYAVAGAFGTAAHYMTLTVAVEWVGASAWAGAALGALVGAITNYVLNYHFSFTSDLPHRQALPRFALVALLLIGLNATLVDFAEQQLGVHYLLAQLVATLTLLVVGFVINSTWTFRVRSAARTSNAQPPPKAPAAAQSAAAGRDGGARLLEPGVPQGPDLSAELP